jgi:putative DNA primase/helicase
MSAAPNGQHRDLTREEIRDALSYLNASDRDTWVRAAFAIKHELGPDGFDLWDSWSQSGAGYDAKDARDVWKSAHAAPRKGGSPITIGTIIGEAQHFGFKLDAERTPIGQDEINRRERERKEREAAAKAEAERRRADAIQRANTLWDAAHEIDGDEHPYLARKGVQSFGLRVGVYRGLRDCLLIPLRTIDGTMVSMQAYFEQPSPMFGGRDRDFLPGGQKYGAFYLIGGPAELFVVCEGYATGATIHQATGYSVAVALDAGNLPTVAQALRTTYPLSTIIVAGDDDQWTDGNPGMSKARQACGMVGGLLAQPRFQDVSSKPTDFNDLHQLEGIEAVRAQIDAALPKEAANDNEPRRSLDSGCNPFEAPDQITPGKLSNTVENLEWMLKEYGITARYNQVRKSVEVRIPGRSYTADNEANAALAELTSVAHRSRMPTSNLDQYVKLLADRHAYNPVCEWITSRAWDGVKRIQLLLDTVRTSGDAKLKDQLMYRWLLSAIASAFKPYGFESHGCLVFTGPQGTGKTTWFRRLVPSDLGLVLTGATLDPADKDSVITVVSHWIVELGELGATFRKADIDRLKGYITKPTDRMRRPYDRLESEYQRRTVFGASVNDERYLVDDTGNRRWWTVPVSSIDYTHDIDMQQVWAELLTHFERGEQWHLTPEENAALGKLNTEHESVDPIEELISSAFKWDDSPRVNMMTASDVMVHIGFRSPTKAQANSASKILKKLAGEPQRKNSGRYFAMPAKSRGGNDGDWAPY